MFLCLCFRQELALEQDIVLTSLCGLVDKPPLEPSARTVGVPSLEPTCKGGVPVYIFGPLAANTRKGGVPWLLAWPLGPHGFHGFAGDTGDVPIGRTPCLSSPFGVLSPVISPVLMPDKGGNLPRNLWVSDTISDFVLVILINHRRPA